MKICIWPDKSWVPHSEIESYAWKSDDYKVVTVGDKLTYDEIDKYVSMYVDREANK